MPLSLLDRIRAEIERDGPLTFARFMELALYDPEEGYYVRGEPRIGAAGDYVTASDAGRAFGACLARQLAEVDRQLGHPDPFHVVEHGAGRGLLARDVLDALGATEPDLAGRLRYVLVDRSPGMREAARARVGEGRVLEPAQVDGPFDGCFLAVELFDALPVHRVRRRDGKLRELCVGLDAAGALVEIEAPPSPGTASWAERYGAAREDGTEAELAPLAGDQLERLARPFRRGVGLVVDYGDRAARLYGPERPRGTLLAYHRHRAHERYLERVGGQDLTAHVNFSALEDRARRIGLEILGLTTQDRFLIANGILEAFEPPPAGREQDPSAVKRRLQAMQLIHPEGMGRRFKVLALAKGCSPRLAGLRDPFARDAP